MKKSWIIALSLLILLIAISVIENAWTRNRQNYMTFNTEPFDDSFYDELSYFDVSDYYTYLESYDDRYPNDLITMNHTDITAQSGEVTLLDEYQGKDDVVLTGEISSVTWSFDVNETGFYHINVNYYPYPGKSSSIEREIQINGEVPFSGASNVSFHRIWGNEDEIEQDINGNDIRPSQIEQPFWSSAYVKDHVGYVNDPYVFYFEAGVFKY